jgi:hypothetical protein
MHAQWWLGSLLLVLGCGDVSRDEPKRPLCVGAHWEELRVDSHDSRDHGSVVKAADGSVIVWGGMGHYRGDDAFVFRDDGWRYFPDTGELRRIQGGPLREVPRAVALGNEIFVGGGSPPSGEAATDIARYSLETESWSTLTPPVPLASPVGVTDDRWWWALADGDLIGYSAAKASWTTVPIPDAPFAHAGSTALVGNELWTWRHMEPWEQGPDQLSRYRLDTHESSTVTAHTSGLGSVYMHWLPALDRVAIWGLADTIYNSTTDGWLVSVSTGAWVPMNLVGALPAPSDASTDSHISSVVDGKRMFVFTGEWLTSGTVGAMYDGDANVWTPLEHECAPPYAVGAAAIGEGKFLVWSSAFPDGETPYETAHIYTP